MHALLLDTETTGLNEPEIIEVAGLYLNTPRDLGTGEPGVQRYRPGKPIEFGAMATHHILDAELVDCPPSSSFRFPEGVSYLVGHNIDFDWKVIGSPAVKRIDTLAMSRKLWPDGGHSQSALAYRLTNNPQQMREWLRSAHSAGADVKTCRWLLGHIVQRIPAAATESWEALWEYSEWTRIPDLMPFGKHKGARIADLPADYVAWALTNVTDMDPYLRKALEDVQ